MSRIAGRRLLRLAEELRESGLPEEADPAVFDLVVKEVDRALRPTIHERRVLSHGSIVNPTKEFTFWGERTGLTIIRTPVVGQSLEDARRFADGLSSWLLRRWPGDHEWLMFDRPAGSERDLVVLADALGATLIQRHPSGVVRIVGVFGVLRTEGYDWHLEPPVDVLVDSCLEPSHPQKVVLRALLEFAVHDLGARNIGALLVLCAEPISASAGEERLTRPPALRVDRPFHLASLSHALTQIDGAAVFDHDGALRQLGIRLVPSQEAEDRVDPIGGTRHTSARRYSYDDSEAIVIAVSEDGPVTLFREGKIIGRSRAR